VSAPPLPVQIPSVVADIAFLQSKLQAPFAAIGQLFDYLRANPALAPRLNQVYRTRGLSRQRQPPIPSQTRSSPSISLQAASLSF
jgi:hypothetical protein